MSEQKVALVTGAGSGIGRATAEVFIDNGYAVALLDVNQEQGKQAETALSAKGDCRFFTCDVSQEEQVKSAIDQAVAHFGHLDAVFNGAGIDGEPGPAAETSLENWDRVMGINLRGLWLCLKYELQYMLPRGKGAIVNCASTQGLFGVAGLSTYVASKHGVVGLTRAAALDYARSGVRINAVCPGMINTPMWQRSVPPEVEEALLASDPCGRLGQPREIGAVVLWLCDPAASFVNGHAMVVDGGMTVQ